MIESWESSFQNVAELLSIKSSQQKTIKREYKYMMLLFAILFMYFLRILCSFLNYFYFQFTPDLSVLKYYRCLTYCFFVYFTIKYLINRCFWNYYTLVIRFIIVITIIIKLCWKHGFHWLFLPIHPYHLGPPNYIQCLPTANISSCRSANTDMSMCRAL